MSFKIHCVARLCLSTVCFLASCLIMIIPPTHAQGLADAAVSCHWIRSLPRPFFLVTQLGAEDFQQRSAAYQSLQETGMPARDWLCRSRKSSCPEIALNSIRLLKSIRYESALADYVPLCAKYQTMSFRERDRVIVRLSRMNTKDSQSALALISRFELDEVLSRRAAVELATQPLWQLDSVSELLGTSTRMGCSIIQARFDVSINRSSLTTTWSPPLRAIASDDLSFQMPATTQRLFRWYFERLDEFADQKESDWAVGQVIQRIQADPIDLIETVDWLMYHHQLRACNQLLLKFDAIVSKDPRLLYRKAELLRREGLRDESIGYARMAKTIQQPEDLTRIELLMHLRLAGLDYWAKEELQGMLAKPDTMSRVRQFAALLLSDQYFREGQYADASETIQGYLDGSKEGDRDATFATRLCYLEHLAFLQERDYEKAWSALLAGLAGDPEDSDLLIALYRFAKSGIRQDSAELEPVALEMVELALQARSERIRALQVSMVNGPRQQRLRADDLVNEMNSFAWLASQTGQHLATAEQYATEANQKSPGCSHILDTLAACLFSQNKVEEAIAFQRAALKSSPWSPAVQAELTRYRSAMMLSELPTEFR